MNFNNDELLAPFKEVATRKQWNNPLYLKKLAISKEKEDIRIAYALMSRASLLKPNGALIRKKLEYYSSLINENSSSKTQSNLKPKNRKVLNSIRIFEGRKHSLTQLFKNKFILLAILPWLAFAAYQILFSSLRYESQAQIIVQQPDGMATMDASMALLTGLGVPSSNTDTELVKAFIYSNDMLEYLNSVLNLRAHYQNKEIDVFSRLSENASHEDFLSFYKSHVSVEIDDKSSVIMIKTQGFDSLYALKLNQKLVDHAEWYINEIGHQLANEQLKFIQGEHQIVESKLRKAQTKLLNFQQQHQLLDPEAEGLAMQQITYSIESQIATKQAELRVLRGVMSDSAPQVMSIENEVVALKEQLNTERQRLSKNEQESLSVSQVLAKFTDYKVEMELALKAYMSSQVSLEKSRIEAYRQLKYLVVVESPTTPEENSYPIVLYNITLFGVCILLLYGISSIILATIRELN